MNQKEKNRKQLIQRVKVIIQVICFVLMPSLFIQIFYAIKTVLNLLIHGQGTVATTMPSIILLVVASVITFVTGRFFCGWMCAFGSMQDFIFNVPRLFWKNSKRYLTGVDHILKWIKYVLLLVTVVGIWGLQLISIPEGISPWDIFGILASYSSWATLENMTQGFGLAGILLLIIMLLSFITERFFCRYLCPLGAYFSIISKYRIFRIVKNRKVCDKCTLCSIKCSMGIPLNQMDQVNSGECIDCMMCETVCPKTNAHLEASKQTQNTIAVGAVSCAVIAGAYYLGNFYETQNSTDTIALGDTSIETSAIQNGIASAMEDGSYTGSGEGFRGETTVQIDVEDGIITEISVLSSSDDTSYLNRASQTIIPEVISSQSVDVDTVSGATYSSNGILSAIQDALSQESDTETVSQEETDTQESISEETSSTDVAQEETVQNEESLTSTDAQETTYQDGTYTGAGQGFRGETDVTVTVEDGKITDITVNSYQDDESFFEKAESGVIASILDSQSVDVDAVSGATYSSNGIKEAVADALDVTYTASEIEGGGHGGGHERDNDSDQFKK